MDKTPVKKQRKILKINGVRIVNAENVKKQQEQPGSTEKTGAVADGDMLFTAKEEMI